MNGRLAFAAATVAVVATGPASAADSPPRRSVEPLRIVSSVHAVLEHTAPPEAGPATGPKNLFFFDANTGLSATTGGAGWVPKTGWRAPPDRPLLLATHDGGASWAAVEPPFPDVLAAVDPVDAETWIALGQKPSSDETPTPLLRRTDDGGASWRSLPVPAGAQVVRFATRELGFAGAGGSTVCPQLAQLWRTTDGGATWNAVPETCGSDFVDIDVVSPTLVFTAQSASALGEGSGFDVIRRSDDGGATWTAIRSARAGMWPQLAQVRFSDDEHGWVTSTEWSQGFVWHAVHVTSDGGRTWRARRFPALPTAFVGDRYAWAGDEGAGYVWRTRNGGRTWRVSAAPRDVGPVEVEFATRRSLAVATGVGIAISRDGARTWTLRPPVTPRQAARLEHRVAYAAVNAADNVTAFVTPDGGRTWRRVRPPSPLRYDMGGVAFADPRHGLIADGQEAIYMRLPVWVTGDGGRSWRLVPVPRRVRGRRVARDAGVGIGPHTVAVPSGVAALLSVDDGAHWQTTSLPRASGWQCAVARPDSTTIWVSCSAPYEHVPTVSLVSHDGGATWRKTVAPLVLTGAHVVGRDDAWALGAGATLWHTTDDGRRWREVWLRIPPTARVFQMEHGPILG